MNELQQLLVAIQNTLQDVEMKATIENMERMLACQQMLSRLQDQLGGDEDGNANAK